MTCRERVQQKAETIMIHAPKPRRRIVSKREYAVRVGNKTGTALFAFIMLFFCMVGVVLTSVFLVFALFHLQSFETLFLALLFAALFAGSLYLGHLGRRTLREARQMDTGVPVTRANTGDLPVSDSLVRASQESTQAQQAVLLRASATTEEKREEQLLRALSGGGADAG